MTLLHELLDYLLALLGIRSRPQPIPVPVESTPRRPGGAR